MPRIRRRTAALELLETRRMPATITVAPVQVVEANAATQATFTATLDEASTDAVTLTYSTANGSARAGRDYARTASTVTIPAGQTSATFAIPVLASDVAGKANEKFYVDLKTTAGNTVASRRVAATIVDGNAQPTVLPGDLTVAEPAAGRAKTAAVTIVLSNPSAKAVRISYATIDATAASTGTGREYQARAGYVTIRPGATSVKVPVRVFGTATSDETFKVALRSATNAALSTVLPGGTYSRVVIQDGASGATRPTISVAEATTTAGTAATFDVTLSAATTVPVSFRYATVAGGTNSADFTPANGVVTIPAGQTSGTFAVNTTGNFTAVVDGVDPIQVELSSAANGVLAAQDAEGIIASNVAQPNISVADVAVSATPGTATTADFVVSLSQASTQAVEVAYATADGTDASGTGYTPAVGFLVFAPGVTSLTVPVAIPAQATLPATGTFSLSLYTPINGVIAAGTATATVTSTATGTGTGPGTGTGTPPGNPTTSQPSITVAAGSAIVGTTGTATLAFTVTLSEASTSTVTVDYATQDSSAVAGTDYVAASGTLTFAPGVTSQVVDVTVDGETTTATNKTFSLTIANATNAIITSNSITGVITYATGTPDVTVSSPSVSVGTTGTGTLSFVVGLSAASAQTVTVDYSTANGTAVAGTDYTATTGTLTFAPGVTSMTVAVPVVGETSTVSTRTLTLNLTNPTNATDTTPTGTGTINYIVPGVPGVVTSNLSNASTGVETSTGATYNAASFTTGDAAYTLNSVDLLLAAAAATDTASVEIYSDTTGTPGTLLGTLTSPTTYATTATSTAFTSTAGIALTADTTYWVVLVANTGSFDWSWTDDDTGTGTGFTDSWAQTGDGTDAAPVWFSYNSSPTQMSVTATPDA